MGRPPGGQPRAGNVAAMTAILLIPLMIMAAFAVDVGSCTRSQPTPKRYDAAALSAVAHLPDLNDAVAAAFAEAARAMASSTLRAPQASFDNPTSYPQILVSLPSNS
ncbi:MAG: pilus assembly protein TadG-related protein [Acidimicrobiales bacterium]